MFPEFGCYAGCRYIRSLTVLSGFSYCIGFPCIRSLTALSGFGCYAGCPYIRSLTVLSGFSYYTGCPCIRSPTVHYELAAMSVH